MRDQPIESAAGLIGSLGAVAIVGAGASFASGLPLTRDLQSLLWHALDADPEARKALADKFQQPDQLAKALIGCREKQTVIGLEMVRTHSLARRAYQEGFSRLNTQRVMTPSVCHECIARLLHCGRVEVVVSLNWDTLFEVNYQRRYGTLPPAECFYKPHGDAARPEIPWVLPHEKGAIPDALARRLQLLAAERPRVLLIVGYSERDEDVVRKIVRPLEKRWHVIRIGQSATRSGAIKGSASKVIPELFQAVDLPNENPGWDHVSFQRQRDSSAAFLGQRLGPADVNACPRLPEVNTVTRLLKERHAVWLTGKSGGGKSITAYQAAYDLVKDGWEVLRLREVDAASTELIGSVSGLPRKTLLLLDDAERVEPNLILRVNELVSHQLTEYALPAIAKAFNKDPVATSRVVEESLLWCILGLFPLSKKQPSKAQASLARKLVNRLEPLPIAKALIGCRQRDLEQYARFLFFVRNVSRSRWKQIVARIDVNKLDATAAGLWATVPHELESLLRAISDTPKFEPARSLLARHSSDLVCLRPMLVILCPDAAAERLQAGVHLDLQVDSGSGWRWSAIALHLLGKLDPSLSGGVIRANVTNIASGFTKLQRLDAEHFPLFIEAAKGIKPEIAEEIATEIDSKVARRHWLERAAGNRAERRAVRALLRFLPTRTAKLRSLVRSVQAKL